MMTTTLWVIVGGLGLLVLAAVKDVVKKMLAEELATRIDNLPAMFMGLALMRFPKQLRDYHRLDWEGNLLAAFHDTNKGKPISRFFGAFGFGFDLWVAGGRIRKEIKTVGARGHSDEKQERLVNLQPLHRPTLFTYKANGQVVTELRSGGEELFDVSIKILKGDHRLVEYKTSDGAQHRISLRPHRRAP
jgi:hypothetical protein